MAAVCQTENFRGSRAFPSVRQCTARPCIPGLLIARPQNLITGAADRGHENACDECAIWVPCGRHLGAMCASAAIGAPAYRDTVCGAALALPPVSTRPQNTAVVRPSGFRPTLVSGKVVMPLPESSRRV